MFKQAINELYSNFPYEHYLKYSAKFKPYRANVRLIADKIQFGLSKKWKTVSKEIQIGLIQELLLKILKNKLKPLRTTTQNIELYNIFMKKIHLGIPKTETDPILDESFNRVNENYFLGLIEKPNLAWHDSSHRLGSYEYGSDTISISNKLISASKEILDYVMYHEILHKKHKFENRKGRNYHHTAKFRNDERKFENQERIERELKNINQKRLFGLF